VYLVQCKNLGLINIAVTVHFHACVTEGTVSARDDDSRYILHYTGCYIHFNSNLVAMNSFFVYTSAEITMVCIGSECLDGLL